MTCQAAEAVPPLHGSAAACDQNLSACPRQGTCCGCLELTCGDSGAVALLASLALFITAMVMQSTRAAEVLPRHCTQLIHQCSLLGTVILSGKSPVVQSVRTLLSGNINTHVLTTLAVLGAHYLGLPHEVSC